MSVAIVLGERRNAENVHECYHCGRGEGCVVRSAGTAKAQQVSEYHDEQNGPTAAVIVGGRGHAWVEGECCPTMHVTGRTFGPVAGTATTVDQF